MFSGIIQTIGSIALYKKIQDSAKLIVKSNLISNNTKIGGSVSVNGICLSATKIENDLVYFDLISETVQRTSFGLDYNCNHVNLEGALKMSDEISGHNVQGHVDTTAKITKISKSSQGKLVSFSIQDKYFAMIVEKAFIAIDGISLTVANINSASQEFTVALIPHTIENTIAQHWIVGSYVNIEIDIINKTIFHYMNNIKR